MSAISEVVDSLEKRLTLLIKSHEALRQEKSGLLKEIDQLKEDHLNASEKIRSLESECESLKLANSMLGSNQYTRETKLKINTLVRELDHCIAQLSH